MYHGHHGTDYQFRAQEQRTQTANESTALAFRTGGVNDEFMKTLVLPLLALATAGGLIAGGFAPEGKSEVAPEATRSAPPQKPAEVTPYTFEQLQPGGPPSPLPATVRCTVVVGGAPTGTYPLNWDGVGWQGLVTVPVAGTRPVFLQMSMATHFPYTVPTLVATVAPFGQATHQPSSAHYCSFGPAAPLNIQADVSASIAPNGPPANVVFLFTN
jgi:hypothetical protein